MNAAGKALVEAGQTLGFHWVEIAGDYMQPTLRAGDHIGVAPVLSYVGEGLHLLDVGAGHAVYRCESDFRGGFTVWADNPIYPTRHAYTRGQFHRALLGKVAVVGKVVDRVLLEAGRAGA